jgi:hypothetical protein
MLEYLDTVLPFRMGFIYRPMVLFGTIAMLNLKVGGMARGFTPVDNAHSMDTFVTAYPCEWNESYPSSSLATLICEQFVCSCAHSELQISSRISLGLHGKRA